MGSSKSLACSDFYEVTGDTVSEELAAAWEAEPRCAECGELVRSALEAALVVGTNRVTHRERCFIPALIRKHPQLKLLGARERAKEGATTPSPAGNRAERTIEAPDSERARGRKASHG
jgi:hypothetical protein